MSIGNYESFAYDEVEIFLRIAVRKLRNYYLDKMTKKKDDGTLLNYISGIANASNVKVEGMFRSEQKDRYMSIMDDSGCLGRSVTLLSELFSSLLGNLEAVYNEAENLTEEDKLIANSNNNTISR